VVKWSSGKVVQWSKSWECLQEISERYLIQNWSYLYLCNFSKEVSQITDWQTYKNFRIIWYKCTNIPGMPPKNFRKISHTELEISLYLSNFSKKVSQLTDWQTYKKFRIIWNKCTNIPGVPPKKFQKDILSRSGDILIFV